MRLSKCETPKCLNTSGVSMSVTLRETNMKSISNNHLQFHNTNFCYMEMAGQKWLTAAEVGQALEYADDKAIHRIFNRHSDEFTQQMTGVVKMTTPGGMQDMRVFSLRGAHLIGMFARTPKAKEFRRWVLDILDREVAQGNINPVFDFDMHAHNTRVAQSHMEVIYKVWKEQLSPSLRAIGSPLASSLEDRIKAAASLTYGLNRALGKVSKNGSKIH